LRSDEDPSAYKAPKTPTGVAVAYPQGAAVSDESPTNADYDAALRLSREYIYDGHEPYAPAVSGFARMLAAHRRELQGPRADRYGLGEVVGCYLNGRGTPTYGVVVQLPEPGYPRYRVRVSTTSFRQYIELGVLEEDLTTQDEVP
jgi:hypothetical protein